MTEASRSSGKVTLFHQDPHSGVTYRIPALLCIPPDTLLAFAEKRSSARDEDAECLVLRRGRKTGSSVEWGPSERLTSAELPGHRTMNPCPVYERKSRTVFLFFICVRQHVTEQWQIYTGQNAARLCYVRSEDAGWTWSSLMDLTEQKLDLMTVYSPAARMSPCLPPVVGPSNYQLFTSSRKAFDPLC